MHLILRKIHKCSYFVYYFRDFIQPTKPFLWNPRKSSLKFCYLPPSVVVHICAAVGMEKAQYSFTQQISEWVLDVCPLWALCHHDPSFQVTIKSQHSTKSGMGTSQ